MIDLIMDKSHIINNRSVGIFNAVHDIITNDNNKILSKLPIDFRYSHLIDYKPITDMLTINDDERIN